MRYAIYFTPAEHDPLQRIAAAWLGRDPFTSTTPAAPTTSSLLPAEIAFHTAAARRYGFHATLKAPFQLAPGESEAALQRALAAFAGQMPVVVIPRPAIARIDGFFAIVPDAALPALQRLAGDVVVAFDRFRAPLTETEIERRNPDALSPAEFRNLCQWGYPYVFEAFRFHMTLTGRVAAAEVARVHAAIDEVFGAAITDPIAVDALTLFVEPEPGAPFRVHSRHILAGARERRTA
jgi:putative phosphonate metabolism protein